MATCWNRYSERRSRGKNILGCERLQNTKYLASKCCLKQMPKVKSILVLDYLSESKTQLVNQRKQKVAFNPGTAHSPKIQSYRMWWGAASPILNDTPVVCMYASYNRNHIKNASLLSRVWTSSALIRNRIRPANPLRRTSTGKTLHPYPPFSHVCCRSEYLLIFRSLAQLMSPSQGTVSSAIMTERSRSDLSHLDYSLACFSAASAITFRTWLC